MQISIPKYGVFNLITQHSIEYGENGICTILIEDSGDKTWVLGYPFLKASPFIIDNEKGIIYYLVKPNKRQLLPSIIKSIQCSTLLSKIDSNLNV